MNYITTPSNIISKSARLLYNAGALKVPASLLAYKVLDSSILSQLSTTQTRVLQIGALLAVSSTYLAKKHASKLSLGGRLVSCLTPLLSVELLNKVSPLSNENLSLLRVTGISVGMFAMTFLNRRSFVYEASGYRQGHIVLQAAIKCGMDVTQVRTGKNNYSCLHLAAQSGNINAINTLLANGADANSTTKLNNQTPLHLAAQSGNIDAIETLLASGADVNSTTEPNGQTPLHFAASKGDFSAVKTLIDNKADTTIKNKSGNTALELFPNLLFECVESNDLEFAKTALEKGADINSCSTSWQSDNVLSRAVEQEKVDFIQLFLENNADTEARSRTMKERPLDIAVRKKRNDIVELLIENGAKVEPQDAPSDDLNSPLFAAIHSNDLEVMQTLLKNGADVEACKGYTQETPLQVAAKVGNPEMVKLLLEYNADPQNVADYRKSALHIAAEKGYPDVVSLLVIAAPDQKTSICFEGTPLHLAAANGRTNVIEPLAPDMNDLEATQEGHTARDLAQLKNYSETAELLESIERTLKREQTIKREQTPPRKNDDVGLIRRLVAMVSPSS